MRIGICWWTTFPASFEEELARRAVESMETRRERL
jgi:hypothetical protein